MTMAASPAKPAAAARGAIARSGLPVPPLSPEEMPAPADISAPKPSRTEAVAAPGASHRHHSIGDPDTGGSFTVKRYRSEKTSDDQLWSHAKVVLEPLNPAYSPIELDESAATEIQIIAELVDVLVG